LPEESLDRDRAAALRQAEIRTAGAPRSGNRCARNALRRSRLIDQDAARRRACGPMRTLVWSRESLEAMKNCRQVASCRARGPSSGPTALPCPRAARTT